LIAGGGLLIERLSLLGWVVELGPLAGPVTLVWLLVCTNALNLIDGMDGLLGTVGLIALCTFAALALMAGQVFAAAVALALDRPGAGDHRPRPLAPRAAAERADRPAGAGARRRVRADRVGRGAGGHGPEQRPVRRGRRRRGGRHPRRHPAVRLCGTAAGAHPGVGRGPGATCGWVGPGTGRPAPGIGRLGRGVEGSHRLRPADEPADRLPGRE